MNQRDIEREREIQRERNSERMKEEETTEIERRRDSNSEREKKEKGRILNLQDFFRPTNLNTSLLSVFFDTPKIF